jgi:ABC-type glutathione transport system ATPase component
VIVTAAPRRLSAAAVAGAAARGGPSILISHNLPLVAAHCQRIGVLRSGVLVEEGPAADLDGLAA